MNGFGLTELNQTDADKFPGVTAVSLLSSGLAAFFSMCFQLLAAFIPKPLPLSTALHWRKFDHFSREVLPSFYLLPYLLCQMPRCAHVPVSELTTVRFAHPHFLPVLTSSCLGCITCTSVREVRMHRWTPGSWGQNRTNLLWWRNGGAFCGSAETQTLFTEAVGENSWFKEQSFWYE